MAPTRRRRALDLLRFITRYIRPGTTIITDEWRAYRQLTAPQHRRFMYRHLTVHHNRYFVDPNGIHTQPIESKWGKWKKEVRRMNGIRDRQIRSHLDEFLWRERFGAKKEVFFHFWSEVAAQYPVDT